MAFVRASISPAWPLGAWLSFGVLAVIHAKRLQRFERAQGGRARLPARPRSAQRPLGRQPGRDGAAFLEDHPYARDLDLFGPASLFELLNTTRTEIGELTLADWLRAPAPLAEVRARQAAVDELRPMLDFKEDVAVLASESPVGRTGLLAAWAGSPPVRFAPALRLALAACALVTIVPDRRSSTATSSRRNGSSSGCSSEIGVRRDLAAAVPPGAARHRHARARSRPAGRPARAHRVGALHVAAPGRAAPGAADRRRAAVDADRAARARWCRGSTRRTT